MTLTLSATGVEKPGALSADGSVLTIEVAAGTTVTFTIDGKTGVLTDPSISREQGATGAPLDVVLVTGATNASASLTVMDASYGRFIASATVDGAGEPQKAVPVIELVKPVAAPAPTTPAATDDGVSELSVGELDRTFAYTTLGIAVVLSAAIAFIVWSVVERVLLPASGTTTAVEQVVDGSFGQRMASIVLVVGVGLGGIVLILGAWLAAVETRGRLHGAVKGDAGKGAADGAGLAEPELTAIGVIIDKARRLRGSMAVVIAGAALCAISLWGVNAMAAPLPAPAPTVTVTAPATEVSTAPAPGPSTTASTPSAGASVGSVDPTGVTR